MRIKIYYLYIIQTLSTVYNLHSCVVLKCSLLYLQRPKCYVTYFLFLWDAKICTTDIQTGACAPTGEPGV